MVRSRHYATAAAIVIVLAAAGTLVALGRSPICTCGDVDLWVGTATSARTSQMLSDWYSASHIVHGFVFYGLLWLVARKSPVEHRFAGALLVECAWEIVENTPLIIDRYREATVAIGYTGDSVLNSMSDIAMMAFGFALARRLPLWVSLVTVAVLEIVPLLVIRDNLTLNVWMLLAPNEAVRGWQAAG
jgi:hypothetical protein